MGEIKDLIDKNELVTVIVCAENKNTKERQVHVANKLEADYYGDNRQSCKAFFKAVDNWQRWTLKWKKADTVYKMYEFKGTDDIDFEMSCAWVQHMEVEEYRGFIQEQMDMKYGQGKE